jgi:BirA family biotin operon repressor/biotin-[acetyl-CoA-carboxylase] ligase
MSVRSTTGGRALLEPSVAPDHLSIEHLRRHLDTERVGFQTYLFWEVASTNLTLRHLAEAGAAHGTVVLAETQSAGRGRLGKPWFSPPGANLHASVLFRPAIRPGQVAVFSFAASLALTDAVRAQAVPAAIKWPNDLLVRGRKAGGSLVSYAVAGDVVEYVVLGVGVNVNLSRAALADGLGPEAERATSLAVEAGRPVDRNRFAATFLNRLERWTEEHRRGGDAVLLSAWSERDALANHRLEVRVPGEPPFTGRALGVGADGRLCVETDGGERRAVHTAAIVVND